MPTYEYVCTACGHRLEAVQSFTDDPLTDCPECGGALRKVYGAVGIVLKGSGFYKNDSRAATSNGSGKKGADSHSADSHSADSHSGDSAAGDSPSKKESSTSEKSSPEKTTSDKSSASKESAPASSGAS